MKTYQVGNLVSRSTPSRWSRRGIGCVGGTHDEGQVVKVKEDGTPVISWWKETKKHGRRTERWTRPQAWEGDLTDIDAITRDIFDERVETPVPIVVNQRYYDRLPAAPGKSMEQRRAEMAAFNATNNL